MTLNCAHRGASGHAPENTLAALRLAVAMGADMVEVDVQLSRDGQPVLIHDETLDRTTSGTGPVAGQTMAELSGLDAGSWLDPKWRDEKLPALAEVLDRLGQRVLWNIELKDGASPELEDAVLKEIARAGCAERCLLTSFDHRRVLGLARRQAPVKLGCIVGFGCWQDALLDAPVQVLSLERSLVDASLTGAARAAGKEVHVWTVNSAQEMRRLLDLGVDAVITNHPDIFQTIRESG
jgi:glycerophosphoryl diester phosphodiesterase